MATLLHQKSHNPNITKNELCALKQLRSDKTTIITRTHERNTTGFMSEPEVQKNDSEYLQKGQYKRVTA